MGRAPCCDKGSVKKGPWSPEEDAKLKQYIHNNGTGGNWIAFPHKAGLNRCGKSCRLRWLNYLRPNIKHGDFTDDEDRIICSLFTSIGTRWSIIAAQLPGRTDNDIKNYWNTKLKKKLIMGLISTPMIKSNPVTVSSLITQASPPSSQPSQMEANVWSFADPTMTADPSPSCYNNNGNLVGINNMKLQPYYYEYYIQDQNFLSFGGDHHQASCSSSDGSSVGNHLGYGGGEMEYDYGGGGGGGYENRGKMGHFENVLYDHGSHVVEDDHQQKLMVSMKKEGGCSEKLSGVWKEETPLDYSLEEINRLISSSNCNNNNNKNKNNVSFDETYKSGDRFMYY